MPPSELPPKPTPPSSRRHRRADARAELRDVERLRELRRVAGLRRELQRAVELHPELLRATELRDVERSRKPQRVELRCELRRVTELQRGLRRTIELWQQLLRAIELRAVEWLRGLLHRLCGCATGGGHAASRPHIAGRASGGVRRVVQPCVTLCSRASRRAAVCTPVGSSARSMRGGRACGSCNRLRGAGGSDGMQRVGRQVGRRWSGIGINIGSSGGGQQRMSGG